ncbi:enoyl-CoA hydratase/isomerase family protein [Frankia sp. QA3]|uniref:enoyl-CoA hydratase/isomerase family protein n=1 Tax=Frankia sp. QA3 TaxID=710111 RepID=UPI000269B848|nr:enoyl-CoA hydratase/isomerase family protein [Frankia sp. QA3]EIV90702.1 enoyl-CoA hydratase/carnithine racemase [Frankia sp. QA3]
MPAEVPVLTSVLATLGDDHVLTLTLNRPERLNSFNQEVLDDFRAIWDFAAVTDDVHVVVLRAQGERAFSTGVDVVEGYDLAPEPLRQVDPANYLSPKFNQCWKPLVCAVHGMAAGGALYWLNEADIIIAGEDATFFDPHVTFGMTAALEPIGLARRIPIGEVLRMALLGNDERMSARRAHEIGFVSEVVPRDRLWPRAQDIAERIARHPTVAVQQTVRAIWESLDSTRTQALRTGLLYVQVATPPGTSRTQPATRGGYEVR